MYLRQKAADDSMFYQAGAELCQAQFKLILLSSWLTSLLTRQQHVLVSMSIVPIGS